MPSCPQCTKPLREITRRCPSCQADLDLLVDYVSHLQGGLERAETLVKAGDLGQAIWAYLEVLEVDPDNPQARKQISQVVTAVRQFDTVMPGRRWANNLPPLLPPGPRPWWHWAIFGSAVLAALALGFFIAKAPDIEWPTLPANVPEIKPANNHQLGPRQ
ncbi:MAG: hypothetical protein HYX68_02685 [Planctomycetes bacterium]|nr:hypothetical protein [Planctomycetota bacterium]